MAPTSAGMTGRRAGACYTEAAMGRLRAVATLSLLLSGVSACAVDGPKPTAGERCTAVGASLLECGPAPLTGAEDTCWRLVDCGAIPVANADSDPTCCFDWAACVEHIEDLPDEQFEAALACIEAAACRDLQPKAGGGHAAPA